MPFQWTNRDLLLVLGTLLIATFVARLLRRWRGRWRSKRRLRRSSAGEKRAEALLKRRGFRVEARQVTQRWTVVVDGRAEEVVLRADFLCRRKRRRFVADAKTGALAPSVRDRATRRQLLEYFHAFDVDGVLLIDAEAGEVHEVVFPPRGGSNL